MLTKKDKKKRYNRPYKQGQGHQFGWGAATKTAIRENMEGAVGGLMGAASAGINAGIQNAELQGVDEAQSEIDARQNFQSTASTNDDLLSEMMGASNTKSDYTKKDFMQDGKTIAMNTINATLQGAAGGASAGPWGAVAGAAAGIIGGLAGWGAGAAKAKTKAAEMNEAAKKANTAQAQTLTAKAGALDQAADARSLAAYYAEGGRLGKTPQFPEFPSSLVKFNTGGTHEENPYDGIPQGIAPDGLPNLVEEGEVKYNDYIFSDRLMLNKKDKKKYKFLSGNTYADAADKISKESIERPNDIISKNTRDANLKVLEFLQERERQKRGLQGENRMMHAYGGHTYGGPNKTPQYSIYVDPEGNPFSAYTRRTDGTDANKFALEHGAVVSNDYEIVPKGTEGASRLNMYRVQVNPGDYTGSLNYYSREGKPTMEKAAPEVYYRKKEVTPVIQDGGATGEGQGTVTKVEPGTSFGTPKDLGMQWYYTQNNTITPVDISRRRAAVRHMKRNPNLGLQYGKLSQTGNVISASEDPILSFNSKSKAKEIRQAYDSQFDNGFEMSNLLQAAPILGNAIGTLAQAINTPDYEHAKELQQGEKNIFTPISYTPITQRMTYKPMDVNYYGSKLGAQAGAARQAIRQQTATNPYAATAALLAADANAQGQLGDLYKKAEEYNLAQREKVDTFNRATDSANAEMAMKVAQLNASLQDSAAKRQLARDEAAAKYKLAEDQAWSEAMATSMTSLFDNLGAMGKEDKSSELASLKLIGDGITYTPEMEPLIKQIFKDPQVADAIINAAKNKAKKDKAYGGKIKRKKGYTI